MPLANPMYALRSTFTDKCGTPLAGGKVYTYENNSLIPKATFTDAYMEVPNTNPIILDEAGGADIFLDGDYRIQVFSRNDTLIDDRNGISNIIDLTPVVERLNQFNNDFQTSIQSFQGSSEEKLNEFQQAIDTAAAAGAGANGWLAQLVLDASGKSQQEINDLSVRKVEVLPYTQTKDSFKNSYSSKRTNQFNKLRDKTPCGRAYIWKNPKYSSDSAYKFSLGINQSGWKTTEWEFIADVDDFYRMRYGHAGSIRAPSTTLTATNLSKTPQRVNDNAYFRSTTDLNATFDVLFDGVGILFNHYVDNNGGIFEVSIDGGQPFIISTHVNNPQNAGAVSARMSKKIGGNLEKTTHTAKFKFVGDDRDHPPASGVSRGWFKYNDGMPPEDYTANLITGKEMGLDSANTVLLSNGILEFAISATPVGSGFAADWVPAHNSSSGCIVINKRSIFIDNDLLDDNLSIISAEREIKEFTMTQEYTAYNSSDINKAYPMWSGVLITKFNRESGLSYNHSFERDKDAGYDVLVTQGYTASCSGQRLTNTGDVVFTKITHDNGYEIDISAPPPTSQITHQSGVMKSVVWTGPKYGLAMNVESPESSGAIGRDTTDGVTTFTTERPDRFNKVYFKPLGSDKLFKAGDQLSSKHSIWLATF